MAWLFKPDGTVEQVRDNYPDAEMIVGDYLYESVGAPTNTWWYGQYRQANYWSMVPEEFVPAHLKAKLLLLKD